VLRYSLSRLGQFAVMLFLASVATFGSHVTFFDRQVAVRSGPWAVATCSSMAPTP